MSITYSTRVAVKPGVTNFQVITNGFWEAVILPDETPAQNRSALWLLAWSHSHLARHAKALTLTDIGERLQMDRGTVRALYKLLDGTPFAMWRPGTNGLAATTPGVEATIPRATEGSVTVPS